MLFVKGRFLKANGLTKLTYDFEVPIDLPNEQITFFRAGIVCLAIIPKLDFISVVKLESGNLRHGKKQNESLIGKILWVLPSENSDNIIEELVEYKRISEEGTNEKQDE